MNYANIHQVLHDYLIENETDHHFICVSVTIYTDLKIGATTKQKPLLLGCNTNIRPSK